MDSLEIKLRCIEAAAKNPVPHKDGFAAGVQEAAKLWADWVMGNAKPAATLTVPKKVV